MKILLLFIGIVTLLFIVAVLIGCSIYKLTGGNDDCMQDENYNDDIPWGDVKP